MDSADQRYEQAAGRPAGAHGRRRRSLATLAMALAAFLAVSAPAVALPPTVPGPDAYTTNGAVHAIASANGTTYVGGDFTRVGRRTGSGVVLSPTGDRQGFPEVAGGDVHTAVSDGGGGWFIGGDFTAVGGQSHIALAHIRSDGTADPNWNVAATDAQGNPGEVDALVLSSSGPDAGTLYVGGSFGLIGAGDPFPHTNLAALRASDGTVQNAFAPGTACTRQPYCSPAVSTLALTHVTLTVNGSPASVPALFAGGGFDRAGSSADPTSFPNGGLALIWGLNAADPTGGDLSGQVGSWGLPDQTSPTIDKGHVDAVWAPPTSPAPTGGKVYFAVYVGGDLSPGDTARPVLQALQFQLPVNSRSFTTTTAPVFSKWNPSASAGNPAALSCGASCVPEVRALAMKGASPTGSTLYFGGDFTALGSTAAPYLARIPVVPDPTNTTTGSRISAQPLGAGAPGPVRTLSPWLDTGSALYVGGAFPDGATGLDASSGAQLPNWKPPRPDGPVDALQSDGAHLYLGGGFRSIDSLERHGLAAFDAGGNLLPWAPNVVASDPTHPAGVHALAATGDAVYVGGRFDGLAAGGHQPVSAANLGAVDPTTGDPSPFGPGVTLAGGDADVRALALLGSTLYVGGVFDRAGTTPRSNLEAVSASDGSPTSWDPQPDADVNAVVPACGGIYIGGNFTIAGGQPRDLLAEIDPTTGGAAPWDPAGGGWLDGSVVALTRSGSTLYAGGTFRGRLGGADRQYAAGLSLADGVATGFKPTLGGSGGTAVSALGATADAVYVGGLFESATAEARRNVAALDPNTGDPLPWAVEPDGRVLALNLHDDTLAIGGRFASLGSTAQAGLASLGPGAGAASTLESCADGLSRSAEGGGGSGSSPTGSKGATLAGGGTTSSTAGAPPPAVTVEPSVLRVGRGSLTVRYLLAAPGRVRVRFERKVVRACRPSRRRARCARYVRFATATARASSGSNRFVVRRQRIGGRRLIPGRYRVSVTTVAPWGSSLVGIGTFRVVPTR